MSSVVNNAKLDAVAAFMSISNYAKDLADDSVVQLKFGDGQYGNLRAISASTSNTDKVKGHGWTLVNPFHRRSESDVQMNNHTRAVLVGLITKMYGAEAVGGLPPDVLKALKVDDSDGKGHPLSARRIKAITTALKNDANCPRELQSAFAQGQIPDLDAQIMNAGLSTAQRREALFRQVGNYACVIGEAFVPPGEARRKFDDLVGEYVRTLESFSEEYEFGREDNTCAKTTFGVFARLAIGGRSLSLSADAMKNGFLKEIQGVANGATSTMRTIMGARHPKLAVRVAPFLNEKLVILCLKNADAFADRLQDESRPLTRADVYRAFTGADLPEKHINASNRDFNKLVEKHLNREVGARLKERMQAGHEGGDFMLQHTLDVEMALATMCGDGGLACDMDTAIQLRTPYKGVSLTRKNVQCAAPLYDVELARNKGLEKLCDQLRIDLVRNHSVYHVGNRRFDCRALQVNDGEPVLQQLVGALQEMFKDDPGQLLVAGFGITQAGNRLTTVCPLALDGGTDHAAMEFTITRNPETGVASYTAKNIPPPQGLQVTLSYSFDIQRDGESVLTDINYNVPRTE